MIRTSPTKPARVLPALGLAAAGTLLAIGLGRGRKVSRVAPELRSMALFTMPPLRPTLIPLIQLVLRARKVTAPAGLRMSERWLPTAPGGPDVRVLILERENSSGTRPALMWLHGGGYLIGTPEIDLTLLARVLKHLDVTIFSVDYRLAPSDPFPAALDDAMTVLCWLREQSEALGIDPGCIAVGGNSAGGGLAAAVAQRAYDESVSLVFQLLMYPMLDDRTVRRTDQGERGKLMWTQRENRYGWTSYLGQAPGGDHVAPYAAPARREELAGLPPAWIGVGSLDLFYEEDVDYAERLSVAGVPCTLDVVADAPHAFDLLNFDTATARSFHDGMIAALAAAYTVASKGADR